ncbi:MAG: toll/interleukin-1 receptor domain-containing protein, partial [Clostridia bacterium]
MEWDVFISHASEDKNTFVIPLAMKLSELKVKVWFDMFTLKVGDRLSRSIDRGLANSNFGIVVISKAFIKKNWTEYELQGLVSKELGRSKVILPIWHDITREDILKFSPTLADKYALLTENSAIDEIAYNLLEVIRPDIFSNLQRIAAEAEMRRN